MDLSALLASIQILAKEIGKGGGGSTEEPTVCMSLLPVALGVALVGLQRLRQLRRSNPTSGAPPFGASLSIAEANFGRATARAASSLALRDPRPDRGRALSPGAETNRRLATHDLTRSMPPATRSTRLGASQPTS